MESIDFYVKKEEKSNRLRLFDPLRSIGKVFRLLELCLALAFISWASTRVPFAIELVVVFIRRLVSFVGRPLFVFLLSNAIIVAVIAKSSKEKTEPSNGDGELYNDKLLRDKEIPAKMKEEEEIVYEDKEVIIISEAPPPPPALVSCRNGDIELVDTDGKLRSDDNMKVYQRSKSNLLERRSVPVIKEEVTKFRRSETEKFDKTVSERLYSEEEMSNEEFRRTIDAFIAKQLTFRRHESLAVVVHEQA